MIFTDLRFSDGFVRPFLSRFRYETAKVIDVIKIDAFE
jgi:hypothetical protein